MFWDGFNHLSKRMTDECGNPMLLKLKDWPPDNDFSNYLPRCAPVSAEKFSGKFLSTYGMLTELKP
jgi:hypothetical protein